MGFTDREYYREEASTGWPTMGRSVLTTLILINVAVLVADLLFGGPQHRVTSLLALRSTDLFQPWMWWHFLTFGFVHDPEIVGHIVLNMLVLFWFGREMESLYGSRRFLRFYVSAVILGGLGWAVRQWFTASDDASRLIGASGAVTAVFMLFVYHFPRRTVLLFFVLPVPAWLVGVLFVLSDVAGVQGLREGDWGRVAYDVHLWGAAYGLLYGHFSRSIDAFWSRWSWKSRWLSPRRKVRIYQPDRSDDDAAWASLSEQADAILEKVNRHGIDSLTARERELLEEYSRLVRQRRQ